MHCLFCNNEITGTVFWVGPKKLGMTYCNYECYIQNFMRKYPDVLSEGTKKRIMDKIKSVKRTVIG